MFQAERTLCQILESNKKGSLLSIFFKTTFHKKTWGHMTYLDFLMTGEFLP